MGLKTKNREKVIYIEEKYKFKFGEGAQKNAPIQFNVVGNSIAMDFYLNLTTPQNTILTQTGKIAEILGHDPIGSGLKNEIISKLREQFGSSSNELLKGFTKNSLDFPGCENLRVQVNEIHFKSNSGKTQDQKYVNLVVNSLQGNPMSPNIYHDQLPVSDIWSSLQGATNEKWAVDANKNILLYRVFDGKPQNDQMMAQTIVHELLHAGGVDDAYKQTFPWKRPGVDKDKSYKETTMDDMARGGWPAHLISPNNIEMMLEAYSKDMTQGYFDWGSGIRRSDAVRENPQPEP